MHKNTTYWVSSHFISYTDDGTASKRKSIPPKQNGICEKI